MKEEDLDDDEIVDFPAFQSKHKKKVQLAQFLSAFTPICLPENAPVQQHDQFSCILQAGANLMGAVLKKENKLPDKECDPKTKEFIQGLLIDIQTGEGIRPRTPEMLTAIAGVLCLAGREFQLSHGMNIRRL